MITVAPSPHARILAQAAGRTVWRDLPTAVKAQAEDLLLDTIAVIAAGGAHPSYRRFREGQGAGTGPCTIIGGGRQGNSRPRWSMAAPPRCCSCRTATGWRAATRPATSCPPCSPWRRATGATWRP